MATTQQPSIGLLDGKSQSAADPEAGRLVVIHPLPGLVAFKSLISFIFHQTPSQLIYPPGSRWWMSLILFHLTAIWQLWRVGSCYHCLDWRARGDWYLSHSRETPPACCLRTDGLTDWLRLKYSASATSQHWAHYSDIIRKEWNTTGTSILDREFQIESIHGLTASIYI